MRDIAGCGPMYKNNTSDDVRKIVKRTYYGVTCNDCFCKMNIQKEYVRVLCPHCKKLVQVKTLKYLHNKPDFGPTKKDLEKSAKQARTEQIFLGNFQK